MYLKALNIDDADLTCSAPPVALATARATQAGDDALLDLAAALLIRRGPLADSTVVDLAARVRRTHALMRWRGQNL